MVASERRRLKTEVEEEKAALTRDRDAAIEDIRVAKEKSNLAQEGLEEKNHLLLSMTSALAEVRREIAETTEVASKLDVKATAIIREKREMWRAIETLQRDFSVAVKMA